MNADLPPEATPTRASTRIKTPDRERGRPADGDNSALYGLGCQIADRISSRVERGDGRRAAVRRVAADLGLDVATARATVEFKRAVDLIAGNVGESARQAMLAGGRHLSPKLIMQIGRTHPDRQRFAMGQAVHGRHPFARPPAGVDPVFDTLGYGEVSGRIARTTGSLDRVADGLSATTAAGWPPAAKLTQLTVHLDQIRGSCSTLQSILDGPDPAAERGSVPAKRPRARRPCRPSPGPAPFRPGAALGFVAAARGIAEKNARDLPRLLRESPPTAEDRASLLGRLGLLDSAAGRLAEVVAAHFDRGRPRPPAGPSDLPPRPSAGLAGRETRVLLEEATSGPSASRGTYLVVFALDADAVVTVGSLGTFAFPAGHYGYVGSAFGPGGVRARTTRHRAQALARKKWNIDHMKPPFRAIEVWWTHDPIRRECTWSAALATMPGLACPAPGFGSHDCRVNRAAGSGLPDGRLCQSHLYHCLDLPDVHDFARRLGGLVPGHATVYRQRPGPDQRGWA